MKTYNYGFVMIFHSWAASQMTPRKTGPHNARSLRRVAARLQESLDAINAAAATLEGSDRDPTIYPLGSRGMEGTATYRGVLRSLERFAKDAKIKAEQAIRDEHRKSCAAWVAP